MLNKRLLIFLFLLLFISQISFVNAKDNQTEIIDEINDDIGYPNYSINNSNMIEDTHEIINSNMDYDAHSYSCLQGDDILIHIDSFEKGNVTILIDNENYGLFNFTQNEIILIPTYNPDSFYDDSISNICVGAHNISLIFNFKSNMTYDAFVEEDSLNFNFFTHQGTVLKNTFSFNSKLYIEEKEPPEIFFSSPKFNIYGLNADFKILANNVLFGFEDTNFKLGIIISNKTKIVYKKSITSDEFHNYSVSFEPFFKFFNINNAGIYNLTVVNLVDGTGSSVLFEIIKYVPQFEITYSINGTNLIFNFYDDTISYETTVYIVVNNISKKVLSSEVFELIFKDLKPGKYFLSMYCPEDNLSEEFRYNMTFEVVNQINEDNSSFPVVIVDENVTNNTTFVDMESHGNSNESIGNANRGIGKSYKSNDGYISHNKIKKSISNSNLNFKSEFDYIQEVTAGEVNVFGESGESLSEMKSFELQKKSISKSIPNLITKVFLIVIFFISLIIGCVGREKHV